MAVAALGIIVISGSVFYYYVIYLPNKPSAVQETIGAANNADTPKDQTPALPTPQQIVGPTTVQQPIITAKQVGNSFAIGQIQYTVNSAKNLGSSLNSYTAPSKGKYIQVNFMAVNNGSSETSINTGFYIVDNKGRHYDTATTFMFSPPSGYQEYSSSEGVKNPFGLDMGLNKLKPGFSGKYTGLFEVTKDSGGLQLMMGDGSSQGYSVSLGI